MSNTLYFHRYARECDDVKVLPYLAKFDYNDYSGKLPTEFYDSCRQFGDYNEEERSFIFRDPVALFEFASRKEVPVQISDYIADCTDIDSPPNSYIFII